MLGSMANFGVSLLISYKKSVFNHLRGRDWRACLYQFLAELTINDKHWRVCRKRTEFNVFFGIPMTSSTQEIDTRGFVEKQWNLMCSLEFL